MTTQATINIKGQDHTFKYILRYTPSNIWRGLTNLCYYKDGGDNVWFMEREQAKTKARLIRQGNMWRTEEGFADGLTEAIPWDKDSNPSYNEADLQVLFPTYSVDTYEKGVKYAITINTWISGKYVWLGSWILDRLDSLALETGIERIDGSEYVEYQALTMVDPWDLVYDDQWLEWRQQVCGEPEGTNSVGSILNISLYPVRQGDNEGEWVMLEGYSGGSCGINIDISEDDFLGLKTEYVPGEGFESSLHLNDAYAEDLRAYMQETYGVAIGSIRWELVLRDRDNIYNLWKSDDRDDALEVSHTFSDVSFNDWTYWREGLFFQGGLSVLDDIGNECLSLLSPQIPCTQKIFGYLVDPGNFPRTIDLESVNMNNYTINAVNKIQKNVIQMDNPQDSKSGMVLPVFFQTRETGQLVIHPAVTEVIALNLDAYKAQVSSFILQVEGAVFPEIGRTGKGVLFRVAGTSLPNSTQEGTYYILNENGDMVTNGKYVYSR